MIFAGNLDRRINIEQLVVSRDAMGGANPSYAIQYGNIPASVKAFTGREKYKVESAREMSYKQIKIVIRYINGITNKHRIYFEGQYYDILYISEMIRREGLEILAQLAK